MIRHTCTLIIHTDELDTVHCLDKCPMRNFEGYDCGFLDVTLNYGEDKKPIRAKGCPWEAWEVRQWIEK